MGIRPKVWALAGLGLAAFLLLLLWGIRAPQPAATATLGLHAPGEGKNAHPRALDSRARRRMAASRPSGGAQAASSQAGRGSGAWHGTSAPAVAANDSLRASGRAAGEPRVWWPHRPEDRAVERKVAQLGEASGIVATSIVSSEPAKGVDSGSPTDGEVAAAADAVLTEYLLVRTLSEQFPGTAFVPFGYPVEQLRQSLAQQVANLSAGERQQLLEQVNELPGGPAQPVMSNPRSPVIYEGSDADPNPRGVDIDPDPQSVEK